MPRSITSKIISTQKLRLDRSCRHTPATSISLLLTFVHEFCHQLLFLQLSMCYRRPDAYFDQRWKKEILENTCTVWWADTLVTVSFSLLFVFLMPVAALSTYATGPHPTHTYQWAHLLQGAEEGHVHSHSVCWYSGRYLHVPVVKWPPYSNTYAYAWKRSTLLSRSSIKGSCLLSSCTISATLPSICLTFATP